MKDIGTQIIKTQRFILRRFTFKDAESILEWASDDSVTKFTSWASYKNIETARYVASTLVDGYIEDDFYTWAIVDKQTNEAIGSIGYQDINKKIESANAGFCLLRKYWKKGIMTEVLKAANDYMLKKAGYSRIEGCCDIKDKASARVMQKCDMLYEGIRRRGGRYEDGRFYDMDVYAIIKTDIKKNIKKEKTK